MPTLVDFFFFFFFRSANSAFGSSSPAAPVAAASSAPTSVDVCGAAAPSYIHSPPHRHVVFFRAHVSLSLLSVHTFDPTRVARGDRTAAGAAASVFFFFFFFSVRSSRRSSTTSGAAAPPWRQRG